MTLPELAIATTQLTDIKAAIAAGNYTALQEVLLHQSILLHKMGTDFIQKSTTVEQLKHKTAFADLGIRALSQSSKMILAMKTLGSKQVV